MADHALFRLNFPAILYLTQWKIDSINLLMSKILGGFPIYKSNTPQKNGNTIADSAKVASPTPTPPLEARLFVFDDGFVYAASAVTSSQTSRHAGVILISLDDTSVQVSLAKSKYGERDELSGRVIALAPSVSRSVNVGSGGALSIHFGPSHPMYFPMAQCLANKGGIAISPKYFSNMKNELQKCKHDADEGTVRKVFESCAHVIAEFCPQPFSRDRRIVKLLENMQSQSPLDYKFSDILSRFDLSASRFSHLFTANAGLSLRSFLQWQKIKEAIAMFETGASMTEIAHASGFSDSAHFCRTFNKCLGLKPSMFGPGRAVNVQVLDKNQENEYIYA